MTDPVASVDPARTAEAPRIRILAVVLTGLYAWSLTVLPPLLSDPKSPASWAVLAAGVSLMALLSAPMLPRLRYTLRVVLVLFVGGAILSWWATGASNNEAQFGVFGALGWFSFTLALGSLSSPRKASAELRGGPILPARVAPKMWPNAVLLLASIATILLLSVGWTVKRPGLSVLAHIVALAATLLVLRGSAQFATHLQTSGTRLMRPLSMQRAWWLLLVVVSLGILVGGYLLTMP